MKRKKKQESTIFEGIRKPTAPPARKFGEDKPESKIHPVRRRAKHKKKVETDGDL